MIKKNLLIISEKIWLDTNLGVDIFLILQMFKDYYHNILMNFDNQNIWLIMNIPKAESQMFYI